MLSNTASVRIYRIQEGIDIDQVISQITEFHDYKPIELNKDASVIKEIQKIEINIYSNPNYVIPDWVNMIKPYLQEQTHFVNFKKYDLVILIKCVSTKGHSYVYAITNGSGYFHIANFIDFAFGINVLEAVFNPEVNKINAVAEKGIIGDVLAARRFYRRARSIAYEDNFGKYYQNINIDLKDYQVKNNFPKFVAYKYKDEKLKPKISISGSTNINTNMKLNLLAVILLVKDISELLDQEIPAIFNKNLKPLDKKHDKDTIDKLNNLVIKTIAEYCINPNDTSIDFDFCDREFDSFFSSSTFQFILPNLTTLKGENLDLLECDDPHYFGSKPFINELSDKIQSTVEYRKATDKRLFFEGLLKSINVKTLDDQGMKTTEGNFNKYLQIETDMDNNSYFLLDDYWYILKSDFDNTLKRNYEKRISEKTQKYNFIQKWGEDYNEEQYNQQYDKQPNSLYLHKINIDNVELCDALVIDNENKKVYFLCVKDGIGAQVRDLTSQAYMAARIIEEETLNPEKEKIKKLYDQGVKGNRINNKLISQEEFIKYFTRSFSHEYILIMHARNKSLDDIKNGDYKSRIAKYSLVEFANMMHSFEWDFTICIV